MGENSIYNDFQLKNLKMLPKQTGTFFFPMEPHDMVGHPGHQHLTNKVATFSSSSSDKIDLN